MAETSAPRISILLPARNAAETLAACLASVARQSDPDWECVVVDDGSTDDTRRIAQSFSERDTRFRLRPTEHRGLVEALRHGLSHCRGELIARMDADDLMHRQRLGEQSRAMRDDPTLAAIGCHVRLFPRGRLADGYRAYEAWLNAIETAEDVRREAFVECPVAHPTLFARREVLLRHDYRDAGWPEDYDLILRMLAAGEKIGILAERRLMWRRSDDRLSLTSPTYALDRFIACKAAHLATSFLAHSSRYILWGHGPTGRALRRALADHDKHPSHIVEVHPRRLRQTIHGAPVVPAESIPALPRHKLVAAVSGLGPRTLIRNALDAMGFSETHDYVCAA